MGPGINNWGWAIIIVTVIFNLVLLPTRIWTMKSSLKMMLINRGSTGSRKKYANLKINDPKRADMQAERLCDHEGRRREHVRRLPSHAAADAAFLRLLARAAECSGVATGALVHG